MTANQQAIDRINSAKNAYQALGIGPNESLQVVEKRYKELLLQVHPDKNGGRKDATEAFQKLQAFHKGIAERNNNNNGDDNDNDDSDDMERERGEDYQYRNGQWAVGMDKG